MFKWLLFPPGYVKMPRMHRNAENPPNEMLVPLSEIISALSYALDITEGQPQGHCIRSCWIGYHIGKNLSLNKEDLYDLYYTLLLKDAGCSSNAARLFELYGSDDIIAKHDFKPLDSDKVSQIIKYVIKHTGLEQNRIVQLKRILNLTLKGHRLATELIQTRCTRGSIIAKQLGFSNAVAGGIRSLDEHYNGKGRPEGLKGKEIPLFSRITLLAQVADVFHTIGGSKEARSEIKNRRGTWFDPEMVDSFLHVSKDSEFWESFNDAKLKSRVQGLEPESKVNSVDDDRLDIISAAFAQIIDAKSPFTFGHSTRVAQYTDQIAEKIGMDVRRRRWLRRGSLLHDIGKLGVSNSILDKPDKLNDNEWDKIKLHPKYTEEILKQISIFDELAEVAGAHHERLDGKGYYKGLKADDICIETRIMTVADIYDALSAKRPYRDAMPVEKALSIMDTMVGDAIDPECLKALKEIV